MNDRYFQKIQIFFRPQTLTKSLFFLAVGACAQAAGLYSFPHSHIPKDVQRATRLERLSASRVMHLTVNLPGRNLATMEAQAEAMYDRNSSQYRHFLKPDQVISAYAPAEEDYQKLIGFLLSKGFTVDRTYSGRAVLSVTGTVDKTEKAFHVHLHNYQRPDGTKFFAPDVEPSVDLDVPLEYVNGLDNAHIPRVTAFPKPIPPLNAPKPLGGSASGGFYWGTDIRNAYVPSVAQTGAGQTVAIVSFEDFLNSDVSTYCTDTGIALASSQKVTCGSYSNIENDQTEMCLDMEMVNSMAPGCDIVAYEGDFIDAILSDIVSDATANQVSASYVIQPTSTTLYLMTQMALQGQSFFSGAGDGDSYIGGKTTASSSRPTTLTGTIQEQPWVTIVGGTTLSMSGSGSTYTSETVWNSGGNGSGGGFSTSVAIPFYQSTVSMATNNGSTSFRNIPDVACLANDIMIVTGGAQSGEAGTSAATPLWAAFTALVNQLGASSAKPPVGFLNPSLYAIGQGGNYTTDFHDVTTGNNDASGTNPTQYSAVTNYDLATGWGSMKPALMSDLITNYVAPTATITPSPTNTPIGCAGSPGATWTLAQNVALNAQGGGVIDFHDGNGPVPVMLGGASGGVTTFFQLVSGTWSAYAISYAPMTQRTNYDIINFGGYEWVVGGLAGGSTYKNDVWRTVDGYDYSEVNSAASFTGRDNFSLLAYNNKLWVIGGQTATGVVANDVWSSPDGKTWTEATASAAFSARQLQSAVTFNNKMWIMGGKDGTGTVLNDVWSSGDGITWTQASGTAFTARASALATVCGDDIWLIGGNTGASSKDVWVSEDGANWTKETGAGAFGASVSQYAAAAFSTGGNVMVVSSNGAYTSSCCSLGTFTPTSTNSATNTATKTATNTATKTTTNTVTETVTNTATHTVTNTASSTGTKTPTQTATNTATNTTTHTATNTATTTDTKTPTNTATNSPTNTSTNTSTATVTNTVTKTATNSPTNTMTNTATKTGTSTATNTSTNTATITDTNTATNTATNTGTATVTNTSTNTATTTDTNTPTNTATNTATSTMTNTATNTATMTATNTSTNTDTNTATATMTNTPTDTATVTVTNTVTNTSTATGTETETNTASNTETNTVTSTSTDTATATSTNTVTNTLTATGTQTVTNTVTNTATNTMTNTSTDTATATSTNTVTNTLTATDTQTVTNTVTNTATNTMTNTSTDTATATSTNTVTNTLTATGTETVTSTVTNTATNTMTNTSTDTATATSTNTVTNTLTATGTATTTSTPTNTVTVTVTNSATNTATVTATNTVTNTVTDTASNTVTSTSTDTATVTSTNTPTNTATNTATVTSTNTPTNTATATVTNTVTSTSTITATNTATQTVTNTATVTSTYTSTNTATVTATNTGTSTVTNTATVTSTNSLTNTATVTGTNTVTSTLTNTGTPTSTSTATNTSTVTATNTSTNTATGTFTYTITSTPTFTGTNTFTITSSPTVTLTSTATKTATNTSTAPSTATPTQTNTVTMTATFGTKPIAYPNPCFGSTVYFRVPLTATGNIKVEIFTLAFRCVRVANFAQAPVGEDVAMTLVDNKNNILANGLYYVRITTPAGSTIVKLIILR
jgi:hypothetical protein